MLGYQARKMCHRHKFGIFLLQQFFFLNSKYPNRAWKWAKLWSLIAELSMFILFCCCIRETVKEQLSDPVLVVRTWILVPSLGILIVPILCVKELAGDCTATGCMLRNIN